MRKTKTQHDVVVAPVRCLLVVPAGVDAAADLVTGLRRRGVSVREVDAAPAAMVQLARQRYATMIVIEPDMINQADGLVRAARRYHTHTVVWRYRNSDEPKLTRWPANDASTVRVLKEPVDDDVPTDAIASEREVDLTPVTLSEEELAMLLADDDPPR